MMSQAVQGLADQYNNVAAWDAIFRNFNQTHGKGDVGYQPGEKITIKVNLVSCIWSSGWVDRDTYDQTYGSNFVNTSPQMILTLLQQLINEVGVNQSDISVGDTLTYFPNHYWNICHAKFPNVRYLDYEGKFGRVGVQPSNVPIYWSDLPGQYIDYLPVSFVEADHLVNFASLKGHEMAGVTLCGKNHYGSLIRRPNEADYLDLHTSLPDPNQSPGFGHYRSIVDLMGHAHIGGKTLLYIIDGLYGGNGWAALPVRWSTAPFNVDWPSSLFVSQDPVAIDSVGFDFLFAEWSGNPHLAGADDYMHEAARVHDPLSGTFYDPNGNGIGLTSLGVHEHWNNATDKQYSRNLGPGNGIELVSLFISSDVNGDSQDRGGGCFIATAVYGSPMQPHVKVLREFRNRFLLTNLFGNTVLELYYKHSSPVADYIAGNDTLRVVVR
jgi:hypothetical protein